MKFRTAFAFSMLTSALLLPTAFAALPASNSLISQATVSEAQATAIALAKVPRGIVKSAELEEEHGRLVWSFDIAKPATKGVTEIQVDAKTGKIASVKKETSAQEAKEAKADAVAAKK